MPLVKAQCTNCGGMLEVDNSKEAAVCPSCGTPYIVEKAIQQYVTNNTNIIQNAVFEGANSSKQLTERGITQLKLREFEDAEKTFTQMSKKYPGNYKAWLGLTLATYMTSNVGMPDPISAVHTLEVAPEDIKKKLGHLNIYSPKIEQMELKHIEAIKNAGHREVYKEKEKYKKRLIRRIIFSIILFLLAFTLPEGKEYLIVSGLFIISSLIVLIIALVKRKSGFEKWKVEYAKEVNLKIDEVVARVEEERKKKRYDYYLNILENE